MRRLSVWALAGAVVLLGSVPRARAEGNDLTGQRAPEIYVQEGLQGIATGASLAACRGQVVVLKFWFTRCPACRKSLPEFQSLYQRYAPRGVQFVAIAYDQTSRVVPFLRSGGFTFPVAIDSAGVTSTRYGVSTYPTTYVIGADGIVKAYDQLSAALLERELEAARSASTRPGAGRRPLLTFPRPTAAAPTPAGAPVEAEPAVPAGGPSPVAALPAEPARVSAPVPAGPGTGASSEAAGVHAAALAAAPAPSTLRSEPLPADPELVAAEPARATLAATPLESATPASLSRAAAAIEVRDFPAALRVIEAYAATHTDPGTWRPSELEEARRLEGLVRDEYLRRHAAIGAQWQRHELEPAVSAARVLAADYRGTGLERVAATLAQWYESHVPAAAVAR